MKRILFAVLASLSIFSGSVQAEGEFNVGCCDYYQAEQTCRFEGYFTALIMQPTASNLEYAAQANPFNYGSTLPVLSPNWIIQEIIPDYHFGFDIGLLGFFCDAQSNWALNWVRYHSPHDSDSESVPSGSMIGPLFEIGPNASLYLQATGSASFHFDEVNLDYGSTFCHFNKRLRTNLMAGVGFMRILENRSTIFSSPNGQPVRTINAPAKFTGAGPQLVFDFNYETCTCFEFLGSLRSSLFVGTLNTETNYSTSSTFLAGINQSPNLQSTSVENRTGMIPGFETSLGLLYNNRFFKCCRFMLGAGYRAQIYLNALRSMDMGSEVTLGTAGAIGSQDSGVYARTFHTTISDFAMAGPYVSIDLSF